MVQQQEKSHPRTSAFDASDRIVTVLERTTFSTYTYDDNGNLNVNNSGAAITTNSYDKENRLTGVAAFDGSMSLSTFTYDGDGLRRSRQRTGGAIVTFLWDGTDHLMEKS